MHEQLFVLHVVTRDPVLRALVSNPQPRGIWYCFCQKSTRSLSCVRKVSIEACPPGLSAPKIYKFYVFAMLQNICCASIFWSIIQQSSSHAREKQEGKKSEKERAYLYTRHVFLFSKYCCKCICLFIYFNPVLSSLFLCANTHLTIKKIPLR